MYLVLSILPIGYSHTIYQILQHLFILGEIVLNSHEINDAMQYK